MKQDNRYIYLNECNDEEARQQGAKWRCWLNAADMGGWLDYDLLDFQDAVFNCLEEVSKEEAEIAFEKCEFICLGHEMDTFKE